MTNAQKHARHIAELLHLARNSGWTTDGAIELSGAMKDQPSEVLALALLIFSNDLLRAARSVTALQIAVARAEDERDALGGQLQ